MRWTLALVLAAVGCGGEMSLKDDRSAPPMAPNDVDFEAPISMRVDVYPAAMRETADSAFRALPQTFLPLNLLAGPQVEVGSITLVTPQVQTGTVTGFALNPLVASLPGSTVPVDGTVFIGRAGTVQSYASTIRGGDFETWLVPRDVYRLAIIPDDPMLPLYTQDLPVGQTASDKQIDIGLGVPVYGQVRSTSGPVGGALVHVVDAEGNRSASAVADQQGLYQVRVHEGTFTVVCEGREVGQDPVLVEEAVAVDADGANVDFLYTNGLAQVLAEGRVTNASGSVVPGTVVRFVSESLDGFAAGQATWTWEVPTDSQQGTFIAKVVPGVYTVEFLPPVVDSGPDQTPHRLVGQRLDAEDSDLGQVELQRTSEVRGSVVSSEDELLEGAVLDCTEVGFDGRSWFATTDEDGAFQLELPRTPLECVVSPPGARGDLATGRFLVDPRDNDTPTLGLVPGTEVSGRVVGDDGSAESLAVVEVRDLDEQLLGYGLTDDDGRFAIRVDANGARIAER